MSCEGPVISIQPPAMNPTPPHYVSLKSSQRRSRASSTNDALSPEFAFRPRCPSPSPLMQTNSLAVSPPNFTHRSQSLPRGSRCTSAEPELTPSVSFPESDIRRSLISPRMMRRAETIETPEIKREELEVCVSFCVVHLSVLWILWGIHIPPWWTYSISDTFYTYMIYESCGEFVSPPPPWTYSISGTFYTYMYALSLAYTSIVPSARPCESIATYSWVYAVGLDCSVHFVHCCERMFLFHRNIPGSTNTRCWTSLDMWVITALLCFYCVV